MFRLFSRLKIREKILFASIVIATIPFIVTNTFWYVNVLNTERENSKQILVRTTEQSSRQIDDFINTKLLGFLSHSQGAALVSGDRQLVQNDLSSFLLQDPDITSLSVASASGQELVRIDETRIIPQNELKNVRDTGAFKIASFQYGKEYIGPIQLDANKNPEIAIAVPIAYPQNAPILQTFTSENVIPRKAGEITGVLIGTVKLDRLFASISETKVGESGYLYVVDNKGMIVSHPDTSIIGKSNEEGSPNEINAFLNAGQLSLSQATVNEHKGLNNQDVLSTHKLISRTGWGVIVEQPISDISSDLVKIQQLAIPVFMIPLIIVFIFSFVVSKRITGPLNSLVKGTQHIGRGDYDYKFAIKSDDEFGNLANSYRQMAQNIKQSRETLQFERNSLEVERNTLASVLSNIDDGVIALDDKYNVIFMNQAAEKIFGLKSMDAIQKHLDNLVKLRKADRPLTTADMCIKSVNKTGKNIITLEISEKEHKTLDVRVSESHQSSVSNLRYLLTMHDVTKEQQLEEMKLDFVSMAAHELRTPLTAIKGYIAMFNAEKGSKLTKDQTMFMSRINLSAEHLMALVENMLNVSRIERGVMTMDMRPTNWKSVIDEVVDELQNRAKERKITLKVTQPPKTMSDVRADKFRITQVLINLVTNAINYTPPGGSIDIWTEETEHEIITHVKDTGHGIPKEALPHLFTKFFRVSGSLEQGSKGTGLGLYISKSIVDSHKGKIWVTSAIDKGSQFSFSVPKA